MLATPISLRMFLVNTGCWPSLERNPPRTTSFRRSILGSYWICIGAEATSVPASIESVTAMLLPGFASTCSGENKTRVASAPGGGPSGAATAPGRPGMGGAVAGGVRIGGAVAGGVIVGGAVAGGAVAGGAVTAGMTAGTVLPGMAADAVGAGDVGTCGRGA